jgi:hypothetical protein
MVSRTTVCKACGHSKFKESPGWHPFDPFIPSKRARNLVPGCFFMVIMLSVQKRQYLPPEDGGVKATSCR